MLAAWPCLRAEHSISDESLETAHRNDGGHGARSVHRRPTGAAAVTTPTGERRVVSVLVADIAACLVADCWPRLARWPLVLPVGRSFRANFRSVPIARHR